VIVAHHLRKRSNSGGDQELKKGMREWSDQARGSGAIKAHADVIICQERLTDDKGNESVYLGAFSKDAADVEPLRLTETDAESFLWRVEREVPDHLAASWSALRRSGKLEFSTKTDIAKELTKSGVARSTAYRQIEELEQRGLLEHGENTWKLEIDETTKQPA
ncbi:MAG TPA: hypothetical protein VJX67_18645, partial [Blastocatellia bacterium]|nr:hypothetical protein [Blastocatellia bacterium]